ncbi:GspH/FimT family pseudopilin [Pseudomonas citronellolis]|uniref:GspH/FimT family pseudopilin n=1 Tax=Pseudomonas citronellolis TaxID=53408 RepID=UPI000852DDA0|nr:GspH/FimT family pseudopilin [Pseudomonas humi]
MSRPQKMAGFTLIELMIVVVLLAIFASIAMPAMQGLITSNRLENASNDVSGLLEYARMEAATRGTAITVNFNGDTLTVRQGNTPLRQITLSTDINLQLSADDIQYNATGAASETVSIVLCRDESTAEARKIIAERSGRVRHFGRGMNENNTALTSCSP